MNDNWYVNVLGWMINKLKLSWNKLLLYAIIYWYSQDGESSYKGSLSYIQKALNLSRPTVISLLKGLVSEWLIEKMEPSKKTLPAEWKVVVKKLNHTSKETLPATSKETLPNIYNNINKNNNNKEAEEIYETYLRNVSGLNKQYIKKKLSLERIEKALKTKTKDELLSIIKTYTIKQGESISKWYGKAPQYFFWPVERGSKVLYYEEYEWVVKDYLITEQDSDEIIF